VTNNTILAQDEVIGRETESSVISKITRRIVPLLFVLYLVAYLVRINVAFGALQMQRQLHFSDSVYGLGAGIFFIGYLMFQVPSNLMPALTGAIAILGVSYFTSLAAVLAAITVAILSSYATFGPFWAIVATLLEGKSAAAGIALINSVGNLGGFWGPYIIGFVRNATGTFRGGLLIAATTLALSGVIVLMLRLEPVGQGFSPGTVAS
jgi:hypothetical protein